MSTSGLVAVDWGTTSLRMYAVGSDGAVVQQQESADGILTVPEDQFETVLHSTVQALSCDTAGLPIVLSGMVGSRQGWIEAPYVRCPVSLSDLASNLVQVSNSLDRSIHLIPGIETRSATGAPDVIRGEETQIFGALAKLGINEGVFVLPGTHSKWVSVANEQITEFQTYMTGEVFAALKGHTILGRMMSEPESDVSFERGVAASLAQGAPGHLLNQVFSTRTLGLFGELPDDQAAAYLSGLLIGSEFHAGTEGSSGALHIMAGSTLSALYVRAAEALGLEIVVIDPASIVLGHSAIAVAAGI